MSKPYESYKTIVYANEIPAHWDIKRLSLLFTENKSINFELNELNALQFKFGEIVPKKKFEVDAELKITYSKYTMVSPLDLIVNGLNLNYDFNTQRVGLVKDKGIITSAYISISPRNGINPHYYALLLKSYDAKKVFNGMGSGIRLTLDFSELKKVPLPIPPLTEQDQIVRYLDWKLSKINKLIRAKKKQIELLNEQKQAIINKAVTKGLDDAVPMKDSGVIWLGSVPEEWEINRLKRFCKVNASITHLTSNYCDEDKLVFLPMENVTREGVIDCSEKRSFKSVKSGYSSFAKNDIVVAKITPCFENGKGACLDNLETEIGYGTTEFITLRTNSTMIPKYLYYITRLSWFRMLGADVMTGSAGQKRVPSDFIANFTLAIPPINEQKAIINYIEEILSEFEGIISKISKEITLIYEYKTSLISSVVTGKMDVRDVYIPKFFENEEEFIDGDAVEESEIMTETED